MPRSIDLSDVLDSIGDMPWIEKAACANLPLSELSRFFVEPGGSISGDTKALCRSCPVRPDCLEYAYERELAGGYFGGLSPSQRRRVSLARAYELIDADANAAVGAPLSR